MFVAITGGTGFLGGHLARTLTAQGHFATLIARGISKKDDEIRKWPNTNFQPLALTDDAKLIQAFNGADAVAHLAGINREREPGDFHRVHVESTMHVVNAARKAQVKKFVYVSFIKARKDMTSQYLRSKWEGEQVVRSSGLNYTILRPGMVYGPGDQMISSIARAIGILPLIGFWSSAGILEKPINPISVEDMSRILIAACTEHQLSNQTVAVIGPEKINLSAAVWRVASVMRRAVLIVPTPILLQYGLAFGLERLTRDPLVTVPQIRMLSEGMDKPLSDCEMLPPELLPTIKLDADQIRKALA